MPRVKDGFGLRAWLFDARCTREGESRAKRMTRFAHKAVERGSSRGPQLLPTKLVNADHSAFGKPVRLAPRSYGGPLRSRLLLG
jgi:hypothetical protein